MNEFIGSLNKFIIKFHLLINIAIIFLKIRLCFGGMTMYVFSINSKHCNGFWRKCVKNWKKKNEEQTQFWRKSEQHFLIYARLTGFRTSFGNMWWRDITITVSPMTSHTWSHYLWRHKYYITFYDDTNPTSLSMTS